MVKPSRVKPRLEFIPSRFNPWVMRLSYLSLPLLRRVRLRSWLPAGISRVDCENLKVLADCYRQFQAGEMRLLLAFRHCEVDDPLCIGHAFSQVSGVAQEHGWQVPSPVHSHFLYDRGMPLWAGRWLGWYFSRMGGIPVHRGRKLDLTALKAARKLLLEGQFPLSIAPEGATNGHSEIVSPLEPGAAQLAFWGVEDLQWAQRSLRMVMVPIGLQYHYPDPDWGALNRLLSQLEHDSGLAVKAFDQPGQVSNRAYYHRLVRLGQHLLKRMEQFYQRFYRNQFASLKPHDTSTETPAIAKRLGQVLEEALVVGENYFGLPSTGGLISRCRRLEEAGWSYIYREDIDAPDSLPPLDRGLADWIAEEASLHMRHMRLVESFVAVTDGYLQENPSFERLSEISLILFDMVERVKGTKVPRRPRLGWRQATIRIGEPIDVSDRWSAYCQGRRAAKQEVERLTADLQTALEGLIR